MTFITITLVFSLFHIVNSNTILNQKIDVNYDKRIQPNNSINLSINIPFLDIIIHKDNIVDYHYLYVMIWNDDRLIFDPLFHGFQQFHAPINEVWKPSVELTNTFNGIQYNNPSVMIKSDGKVIYQTFERNKCKCEQIIDYLPDDIVNCPLSFISILQPNLSFSSEKVFFKTNHQWKLFGNNVSYSHIAIDHQQYNKLTFNIFWFKQISSNQRFYGTIVLFSVFLYFSFLFLNDTPSVSTQFISLLFLFVLFYSIESCHAWSYMGLYRNIMIIHVMVNTLISWLINMIKKSWDYECRPPNIILKILRLSDQKLPMNREHYDFSTIVNEMKKIRKVSWRKIFQRINFIIFIIQSIVIVSVLIILLF